jgi:hypothetical protein
MANNALALNVATPAIDPVGAYEASESAASVEALRKLAQAETELKHIGSMAFGVMGGKLDGQADPALWEQSLDMLEQNGFDTKPYRGRPDLAPVIAKATVDTLGQLQIVQNEKELDQRLAEFQFNVSEALKVKPVVINGQLVDPSTGEVKGDYRTPESPDLMTVSPGATVLDPATGKPVYSAPSAPDLMTVSPGSTVLDPTTQQPVFTAPPNETSTPRTVVTIYDENGREQKGYMGPVTPENPDGFYPIGGPKADTPRAEFNVSQATAAGYADRMTQADAVISDPKLATVQTDLVERGKGSIIGIGNMLTSPEFQQAEQAQRDFINAILRRESGAVISDSEFDNARKQYFPQPGDSEAVLKQKAANRKNAIAGVARSAGPAYTPPDTSNYLTGDSPDDAVTKVINGVTYTQDANGEWYENE